MANELLGLGTTLSGTTLGAVLNLRDVEGPDEEADDIDISSNTDATAANEFARRFKAGMVDGGEITFTCVHNSTGYTAARTSKRTAQTFTITLSNGTSTFVTGDSSYIKSVSASYPWEEEAVFDVTIKVSGKCTFNP